MPGGVISTAVEPSSKVAIHSPPALDVDRRDGQTLLDSSLLAWAKVGRRGERDIADAPTGDHHDEAWPLRGRELQDHALVQRIHRILGALARRMHRQAIAGNVDRLFQSAVLRAEDVLMAIDRRQKR